MSQKAQIVLISGWLTTLTFVLLICEWSGIQLSPAMQALLFLMATCPAVTSAVLIRHTSPTRSVTQILYDQENEVSAVSQEVR